jgi:hypothetical protein
MSYKTSDMNRTFYYYLLAALIMIGLGTSCNKGKDDLQPTPPDAMVNVINTSSQTINYYLGGARQNAGGIVPGGYTGYTSVPSGDQLLAFKTAFVKDNYASTDTLFTQPMQLESAGVYSFFVTGTSRSSLIITRDNMDGSVPAGNALVRFVHGSGSLPALRLVVSDTVRFSNSTYKSVSDFKPISVGLKTIQLYTTDGTTRLFSTTQTLTSRYYTLFVQGKQNPAKADEAVKVVLLQNN